MRLPKSFRAVATLIVLALFLVYFLQNTGKFRPLLDVNIFLLLLIALINIAGIFVNGLFTKFILVPFNKSIPVLESFYVSLISSVGNFFAPVGAGFGFRAIYLKKKHGLPYSEYISTLAGNYIIVFLVTSLSGLMALYALRGSTSTPHYILVAVFAAIFVVSIALSLVKIPVPDEVRGSKYLKSFLGFLARITNGWAHIVSHKSLMVKLTGLTLFNLGLSIFMYWLIIQSLNMSIDFASLVLFSVLGTLSLFINITPGNLGIKEAVYIFSSTVLGFSINEILLIALIDRGVLFLVLLTLWALSPRIPIKAQLEIKA